MPGKSARHGEWIRTSDILVLSSRFEGFPNVVAEAVVSGLPVVAFDCAYGPRELVFDGVNGLLVQDGNVGALADAIGRLMSNPTLRAAMADANVRLQQKLAPETILALWDRTISDAARKEAFNRGKPAGEGYSHANA